MNKEAFCNILTVILERRFVPPLHGMHFFSVDVCTEPWFVLQWDLSLRTFPSILKVVLQGLVQKGIPPKFMIVLILMVQ